jgi:hypothetical protein
VTSFGAAERDHANQLGAGLTSDNSPVVAGFDYGVLDTAIAAAASAAATRIRELGQQQNETIVAIGDELAAIKRKLGHGCFGAWLKAEFEMSADTAERYMRVAAAVGGKIRTVRILKPTTLYALTAKAMPDTLRGEIVERIEDGEPVSDSEVLRTVRRAVIEAKESAERARRLAQMTPRQRRTKAQREAEAGQHKARQEENQRVTRANTEEAARLLVDRLGTDLDRFLSLTVNVWSLSDIRGAIDMLRRPTLSVRSASEPDAIKPPARRPRPRLRENAQ